MKKALANALVAAALGTTTVSAANAASVSVSVAFPGIGFSYSSGGYCDAWGCPDDFWNYPIYYCPVYYDGRWYRGPMYYRYFGNRPFFWIRGSWRRDYWNGPRPYGACVDRFGPPLDLDFYIWNGFTIRDEWRYRWRDRRSDWWRHRQDWDRSHRNDTNWRGWLPPQQQHYDWSRDRDWNKDRDWSRPDWNRSDWNRRHNIVPPGTGQPLTGPNPSQPSTGDHRDRKGNWQWPQGGSASQTTTTSPAGTGQPMTGPNPSLPGAGDQHDRRGNRQWPLGGSGSGSSSTQTTTNNPAAMGNPNKPPTEKDSNRRGGKHGDQDQGHGAPP